MLALPERIRLVSEFDDKFIQNIAHSWASPDCQTCSAQNDPADDMLRGARHENARLAALIEALAGAVDALRGLKEYAIAIEKAHPAECTHGAGYSLLGQLAQQVENDAHYALAAVELEVAKLEVNK